MRGWSRPLRHLTPRLTWPGAAARPKVLFGCAAGVMACVIGLMVWLLWDARQDTWHRAAQSSENLVSALDHDIERNIELFDLSLRAVADGLRLPGVEALDPAVKRGLLFDGSASAPYLGPLVVLDRTGKMMMTSRADPGAGMDFSEWRFFTVHRDNPDVGLFVSTPFKDPLTGRWVIALSRRLETPGGTFAGVVFGMLHLQFFERLFSGFDVGADGSIALFFVDGTLVYRHPFVEEQIGKNLLRSGAFPHAGPPSGVFEGKSAIDGIDRLYAYRRLGELPLIVSVGLTSTTVFAEWEQKAAVITISMIGLIALVVMLGVALIAELRRRGQAERTAVESGRRYRLLADHSFDMIVRLDPSTGARLYVSPASIQLYGYRPEDLVGASVIDNVHRDDIPVWRQALTEVQENGHRRLTYRGLRRDGSYVRVEASLTAVPNFEAGGVEIVAIVRDISERVRYEAALRQAKQQADAANRSKSEFLATMSHELRTPLNAIIGFTEIMQQEVMGPVGNTQYKSYISDIHLSGTHLLGLINEILDLTRAEAGKLELLEDVFDVTVAIRSVARLSGPRIDEARLTAEVDVPPDLPFLRADERKTKQVLFNLIGNSVKFTPAGGNITVTAGFDPQSGFRITVADTGIGIAREDLARVLEPFAQIDSSLARKHNGTGLGLPVVKAIMELHHGRLELESELGAGTRATVVFPAELAIPRKAAALSAA